VILSFYHPTPLMMSSTDTEAVEIEIKSDICPSRS
jgi:hypothetical protein